MSILSRNGEQEESVLSKNLIKGFFNGKSLNKHRQKGHFRPSKGRNNRDSVPLLQQKVQIYQRRDAKANLMVICILKRLQKNRKSC